MPLGIFVPARWTDLAVDVHADTGTVAQGGVPYKGADGKWHGLGPGTAGQSLRSGGPGADPSWTTPFSGAHSALTGLTTGDDHTQYALLAGRAGGQTLIGDTASGGNLTLHSTAHATKGKILLGASSAYDGANIRLGVGTASPATHLDVRSQAAGNVAEQIRGAASQTGNLTEWQNSAGGLLTAIGSQGHYAFGTAVDVRVPMRVNKVSTDTSGTVYGMRTTLLPSPGGATSSTYNAGSFALTSDTDQTFGTLRALECTAIHARSSTVTMLVGATYNITKSGTGTVATAVAADISMNNSNATGAITDATGVRINAPSATGVLATVDGLRVFNQGNAGTTSSFAVRIENQSGSTNPWALLCQGGMVRFDTGAAGVTGPIFRGAASQTADLQQWQNSSAAVLAKVNAAGVIGGADGSGTNVAGSHLTLAGGRGTGNAMGGDVIFQMTIPGSSGTTLNTLQDKLRLDCSGCLRWWQRSTTADREAFDITPSFVTATDASRKARAVFSVFDTAAREGMRLEADGSNPMVGFLGAAAVVRQTLGAAATDPATTQTLANAIRTALINLGLGQA